LAEAYAWLAVVPVAFAPSPKSQVKEYGGTPPDADAVNVTVCPTRGLRGDQEADGTGVEPPQRLKLSE